MHSPHAEKNQKSGRPLLQTSRLSVHYPRFYLALSKPGSLSFENMETPRF